MMKKYLKLSLIAGFVVGVVFLAAPSSTDAAITMLSAGGDCSSANVTVHFSGAAAGEYQDTIIVAYAGSTYLGGILVIIGSDDVVNVNLSWIEVPEGSIITIRADHAIPSQSYYDVQTFSYPCGPGVYAPGDYIQHNIICDSPVYGEAGGSPVGDDMVLAGQDWHVDPTPVAGPDGQNWTAIFTGGIQIGFIPTSCVGTPTEFGLAEMYE
jgi:hypothetical protein